MLNNMPTSGKALVGASYLCMFLAQRCGAEIIELLHGPDARAKATAPQYEDVRADAPLHELCQGYEAHHWDSTSNCR